MGWDDDERPARLLSLSDVQGVRRGPAGRQPAARGPARPATLVLSS